MIEKIKNEIERRWEEADSKYKETCDHYYDGMCTALDHLETFIDSLEKEIAHKDLGEDMDIVFDAISKVCNTKKPEEFARLNETVYKVAMTAVAIAKQQSDNIGQLPKIKGWVARYANGDLEIGKIKPEYYQYEGKTYISNPCPTISLPKTLFPELHWLDEPIEVELTISRVIK